MTTPLLVEPRDRQPHRRGGGYTSTPRYLVSAHSETVGAGGQMRVRNLMRVFANLRESNRAWLLHASAAVSSRWLLWRQSSCRARPRDGSLATGRERSYGVDLLAAERIECPNCGASLARDVEGHADRGWRIDEEPNG